MFYSSTYTLNNTGSKEFMEELMLIFSKKCISMPKILFSEAALENIKLGL
jgi:hypothetical protein